MKKSFKWILGVSLVASTFMSGCGTSDSGEHEHTYASTYSYDANGHWIETTCEDHEVEKYNLALHIDSNNDGICDTCSYDEHSGAGHTYADVLSKDETNHWYAPTCGHDVAGKDVEAHVDANNDKVCDVAGCGYDYNHTHEYATTWSGDATNHWHAATCGCTIDGADKAAHVDEDKNGVCEVCQLATYEEGHDHTYATEWSSDEDNHWYAATCDHTGLKSSVTAHNDANKDGECDVCGWYDKDHTHTYANEWSKDENNHWHTANCGHTGLTADTSAHTMVNGECTVCGYDGNHEHAYSDVWTTDAEGHWHNATCGCALTVSYDEHDGMDDGVCDTCGYVADCAHTPGEAWITNETSHWHACVDHPAVTYDKGSHTGMADGVCDTCGYKDYEDGHFHAFDADDDWTSDYTAHWIASSCHSGVVKAGTYAEHTDEADSNGYCDVCGQELFDNVIAKILSYKTNVKNGTAYTVDIEGNVSEYYYEFGENYFFMFDQTEGWKYWYHNYNDSVFALQEANGEIGKAFVSSDVGLSVLDGIEFNTGYYVTGAYGLENTIEALYAKAVKKSYTTFTMTSNEDSYAFAFDYLQEGYYSSYIVEVNVEFTLGTVSVYSYDIWDYVYYVESATITVNTYEATKEGEEYVKADLYLSVAYDVAQNGGAATAVSPFDPAEYFVSSYDLTYNDETIENNATITAEMGVTTKLTYANVEAKTGDFTFETMTITVLDANGNEYKNSWLNDQNTYLQVTPASWSLNVPVGTYTVTLTTSNVVKTFKIEVTMPNVSQFDVWVQGDSKAVATEYTVYVGDALQFGAKTNNYADNSYTATVDGEEGDVALTVVTPNSNIGSYVYSVASTVTFNKAGTYTLTLTSTADSNFTATLTVTVTEPPKAEDVIKGTYQLDASNWYDTNVMYVTFTPASEGAVNGTATISIETANGTSNYTVNYAYDATNNIVLKNTDDTAFDKVTIVWENYELFATFVGYGQTGYDYSTWEPIYGDMACEGVLVSYTPPTAEEMVIGEYRYIICDADYNMTGRYVVVLSEDGTGTYKQQAYNSANYSWSDGESATFTWTVVDNGDGTYKITIASVEGSGIVAGDYVAKEMSDTYGNTVMHIVDLNVGADSLVTLGLYY